MTEFEVVLEEKAGSGMESKVHALTSRKKLSGSIRIVVLKGKEHIFIELVLTGQTASCLAILSI